MAMSRSLVRKGHRPFSWPSPLVAIFILKLLASLVLKQTPILASYSSVVYALLLLLAAGLAVENAVQRALRNRAFWLFLAIGFALWSLDQWVFVYYELGLHTDVPDRSMADPTLFLHTIMLMAAVAVRPHLDRPAPNVYRSTLNFLLLLFFSVFLYAFSLLPYQYIHWDSTIYNQRFELLYGGANLALVLVLGVLAVRAKAPWKSIYAHLCGAAALFTLASTIANVSLDLGKQYNVRIYAICKMASVCWFVWVPAQARRLPSPQPDTLYPKFSHRYTGFLAMVTVVAVPLIGAWEISRPYEDPHIRTFRLEVVLAFVIFLAVFALVREFLENRTLAADGAQAREAAHESEGRFRIMADKAPVMIWMSGTDRLCTFFNQGWLEYTGRSMAEEMGNGWASGVHPDDLARCLQAYTSAFDARIPFEMEYRLRRFDGKYRWIVDYGVPRFESNGLFCGYIGSCIDINDRKSAEESLRELGGRLIAAQEEERTRIARELNDDLGQRTALAIIDLDLLKQDLPKLPEQAKQHLSTATKVIMDLSSDIRRISHRLRPSRLDILGVAAALRDLCNELSKQHAMQIHFAERGLPRDLSKNVTLCIFRVVQEALRNVIEHSGVSEAKVELSGDPNGVDLCVSDSGVGFHLESTKVQGRLGLVSIRERVRLVRGQLSIDSQPSRGTTIRVHIPLFAANAAVANADLLR
jgi:PAS domain S-box-containing protein